MCGGSLPDPAPSTTTTHPPTRNCESFCTQQNCGTQYGSGWSSMCGGCTMCGGSLHDPAPSTTTTHPPQQAYSTSPSPSGEIWHLDGPNQYCEESKFLTTTAIGSDSIADAATCGALAANDVECNPDIVHIYTEVTIVLHCYCALANTDCNKLDSVGKSIFRRASQAATTTVASAPSASPSSWSSPSPNSLSVTMSVISGQCSASPTGDCVQSPNYPQSYGNGQTCDISVDPSKALTVEAFNTERGFDKLTVGHEVYHGTLPIGTQLMPSGNAPNSISWRADGSVVYSGWKICSSPIAN